MIIYILSTVLVLAVLAAILFFVQTKNLKTQLAHSEKRNEALTIMAKAKTKKKETEERSAFLPPREFMDANCVGTETYNQLEELNHALLCGKIRLSDIPFETRILSSSLYVMAARYDRNFSREDYIENLQILKDDLDRVGDGPNNIRSDLLHSLASDVSRYFK